MRFAFLWTCLFVAIVLLAAGEVTMFHLSGFRYKPTDAILRVSVVDVSIDAVGEWAAAAVFFRQNNDTVVWTDVVVINLKQRKVIPLQIRDVQPRYVELSPDSKSLAIVCHDGSVLSVQGPWSGTGTKNRRISELNKSGTECLVFSPDGLRLAATGEHFTYVWEWPGGTLLNSRPHDGNLTGVLRFSSDSQHVLSAEESGVLSIWDVITGTVKESFSKVSNADDICDAFLAHDGQQIIVAHANPRSISVLSPQTGQKWSHCSSGVASLAFTLNSHLLACLNSGPRHYSVDIYDLKNGQLLHQLECDRSLIKGLAFAPDDVLYSWDSHGLIRAWDVKNMRELWTLSLLEWASNSDCGLQRPVDR